MSLAMPVSAFTKSPYDDSSYASLHGLLDDATQLFTSSSPFPRPMGGDLDILSASRYPQGLMQPYEETTQNPRKRKARTSSGQLYGGLVLNGPGDESNRSSSNEQEQTSTPKKGKSAKRSPPNDGEEQAAEKKQRGRPRLDTHDETAADRRRTQIRLAQRAYRHRKETTISALKQKVSDLQNTIESMNKTFLTLHDNMVDAGILASHYSLGRQLQAATEEFVALSKVASPESDDEEEAIAAITRGEDKAPSELGETNNNNRRGSVQRDAKSSSKPSTKQNTNVRRGVSFNDQSSTDAEADVEELPVIESEDISLLALSQTAWASDNSNIHGLNDVLSFSASVPEVMLFDDPNEKLVIERPLKPAHQPQGSYTYSFQETTFARRLHRMCLERAFRNLTNPNIDPDYITRAFRFTFCFSNRKRMLQRFQEMLKRRAGESLENWNVPFFHIGGAGTHYPRRDDEGNPIYPPNMVSPAKAFGPQPYVQAETPRAETSVQELLDNIGFGGIWFDSHDVEEYLKTKGIFLDGQSSFVEVDPTVLSLAVAKQSTVSTMGWSTNSDGMTNSDRSPLEMNIRTPSPLLGADRFTDPIIARELSELYVPSSGPIGGDEASKQRPVPAPTLSDDPWAEFAAPGLSTPPSFSDLLARRQNPLTFDVELFLERMIQGSACLGRAPGFRKETIDQALVTSLQESF